MPERGPASNLRGERPSNGRWRFTMIGYIAYQDDVKTWTVEEKNLLGLRFLQLTLPKGRRLTGKYYANRAARAMGKLGIRQAVFPVDFPWWEVFTRRGVLPVDTLPLYRRMAPQIVKRQMADLGLSPGATTVAAVGDNLTGELAKILTEIALQVRYLSVSMRYGAEEFCHSLRREYGISVLQRPTRTQLEEAQVLLLFIHREDLGESNPITLRLYGPEEILQGNGVTFGLPPKLEGVLEKNCCREQVLAALLASGILQNDQIPVLEVDKAGKSYYNADTMTNIE